MPILSRSFVAVCLAVLAACLSAVLNVQFGVQLSAALLIGANLLIVALLVQEAMMVRSVVRDVWDRVEATQAALGPIEERLDRIGARLEAMAQPQASPRDQSAEDIAVLGAMVKDLADNVATLEGRMAEQAAALRQMPPPVTVARAPESRRAPAEPRAPASAARTASAPMAAPAMPAPTAPLAAADGPPATALPAAGSSSPGRKAGTDAVSEIVEAIGADRIETWLQPIVTLPQRKVRSYEVYGRLQLAGSEAIAPEDFLPTAEQLGIAPVVDLRQFLRAAQIVRRLSAKSRDIQVMMNISPRSLTAAAFAAACIDSARQSSALAGQIVFELDQAAVRTLGAAELAGVKMLVDAGYRFCMDQVADLRIDGPTLHERGFRYVKIPASLLLDPIAQHGMEIQPTDLGGLLRRTGVELIADQIDSEATVRDLLDFDVSLAQGDLFAPARPVRADVLAEEPPPPLQQQRPAPPKIQPPEGRRVAPLTEGAPQTEAGQSGGSKSAWRALARRVARPEN